ncbi:unnamed protein product, partial [Onchocerca ochengi]
MQAKYLLQLKRFVAIQQILRTKSVKLIASTKTSNSTKKSLMELSLLASKTGDIKTSILQSRQKQRRNLSPEPSPQYVVEKKDQNEKVVNITKLKMNERINKWIILEFIGKGSFGCVYKVGYHGERYALKFDLGYDDDKPLLVEKNVLELAKRANSKHICRLIDHGNYFGTEYIVMTLVGKSLRDILMERRRKKLSAGCVISVGLQCVEAIEELHRVGFIHR